MMALEASIVERLQELRKWQIDQQERLLKQQQEQRELLSIEQERIYEALGLSIKDVIVDETIIDEMSVSKSKQLVDGCNDNERSMNFCSESEEMENINRQRTIMPGDNSPNCSNSQERLNMHLDVPNVCSKAFEQDSTISDASNYHNLPQLKLQTENDHLAIDETPKRFRRIHPDMVIKGVEPLAHDRSINKFTQIDDLPVPSPKKDFKTLLEEKLRDDNAKGVNNKSETGNQVKRPFLRKGEGLARFRYNPSSNSSSSNASSKVKKPVKSHNTFRFTNSSSVMTQKSDIKKGMQKPVVKSGDKKINDVSRKKISDVPNVAQQKLILSNVALPKKAIRNSRLPPSSVPSPISPTQSNELMEKCISNDESNPSDLDTSKLETKMFEMLEEKAENSSFCSTSSAVVAFMQQSTPIKLKSIRKNLSSKKQIHDDNLRSNDNVLNEIVNTLKSYELSESSIIQILETYSQKDTATSKWSSGPFINENSPQSHARNVQQPIHTIVEPININKNKLYNNNNNKVEINNFDFKGTTSNISSSSESESVYEENSHNTLDKPLNDNYKVTDKQTDPDVSVHVRFAEYNEYKTIGLTDTSILSTDSRSVPTYDKDKNWDAHSENEELSDSEISPSADEVNQQYSLSDAPKPKNSFVDQFNGTNGNCVMNHEIITARESNDNIENSDTNSVDQNTDNETSIFNDSDCTYYDEDDTIAEIQEGIEKILSKNEEEIVSKSIDETKLFPQTKLSPVNDTVFKSDLLKNRLLELEREINIFRKENAALSLERKKLQEERRNLQREFKEKEANLECERNEMNVLFLEEKKRLTREKSALERRLRDAREKSIQTKHERQEIQMMNEQLNELKEEMAEKESRWQATQARQRSQIRVLQMENSKLKLEIERLQSMKRVSGKAKHPNISNTKAIHQINKELDSKRTALKKQISISEEELETVKVIHKKNSDASASASPSKNSPLSYNMDMEKVIAYNPVTVQKPTVKPSEETISKKRHLYETLIKNASVGYEERNYEKSPINLDNNNDRIEIPLINYDTKKDIELNSKPSIENEFNVQSSSDSAYQNKKKLLHGGSDCEKHEITKIHDEKEEQIAQARLTGDKEPQQIIRGSYQQFVRDVINPRNESNQLIKSSSNVINMPKIPDVKNSHQQLNYGSDKMKSRIQMQTIVPPALINDRINLPNENVGSPIEEKVVKYMSDQWKLIYSTDSDLIPRKEHQGPMPRPSDDLTPRPELIQLSQISDLSPPKKFNSSSLSPVHHNIREVKHPDGLTEYWYPNGNVKRVYPDPKITKIIYHNGDVRETTSDDCVKYFYAASKTWHTTYPDGFEILEFPDGQQERRTKDGVIEICFPDGSVRLIQPDGIEKWALSDGTIAETFPNGEKILSLPNGQREIHTAEFKRCEYSDGTVKFVYPDGTQETRYTNGRIRIKDKDGNLIIDSYQT